MALVLLAAACSDGGSGAGSPEPPTPEPGEKQSSTAAIVEYVTGGGLDGRGYQMSDPLGCEATTDSLEARGKVCIYFGTGSFADTSGTIEVIRKGEGERWELTLELQEDLSWRVTGARQLAGE